jgi:hypothetical protein
MDVADVLGWVEHTPLAAAVRGDSGWEWLFPNVETIHVLSLALVFGSIVMVDLRLIGLTSRSSAVSRLSAEILPYTWVAFACAVVSGSLMFISKAHTYFYNLQFQLKFLCMALAGLNMIIFHFGVYRHVVGWDQDRRPPWPARLAGSLSIGLWIAVIFFGRWIGFTT